MDMDTRVQKGKLTLVANGGSAFTAQESKTVKGAIDVVRLAGITEHPSPKQALAMAKRAGISEEDFRKAFGHLLPAKRGG